MFLFTSGIEWKNELGRALRKNLEFPVKLQVCVHVSVCLYLTWYTYKIRGDSHCKTRGFRWNSKFVYILIIRVWTEPKNIQNLHNQTEPKNIQNLHNQTEPKNIQNLHNQTEHVADV